MIKSFFKKVVKHLWVYVLITLVATLLTSYAIGLINQPRNEETITIFVASHSTNIDKMKKEVLSKKPGYIREIVYKNYSIDDPDYDLYYAAYAFGFSDIVIMPESKIGNETILEYYAPLNENIKNKYFPNNDVYKIDEKDYGVIIHKKDDKNYSDNDLITYNLLEEDENYYMFFDADSIHVGELNDSEYTTAFDLMQVFRI